MRQEASQGKYQCQCARWSLRNEERGPKRAHWMTERVPTSMLVSDPLEDLLATSTHAVVLLNSPL